MAKKKVKKKKQTTRMKTYVVLDREVWGDGGVVFEIEARNREEALEEAASQAGYVIREKKEWESDKEE